MAKEKRTKPCTNCKRTKVKCIYSSVLPCERCIKIGQASSCGFAPKLPNIRLPVISTEPNVYTIPQIPANIPQNISAKPEMVLPPYMPLNHAIPPLKPHVNPNVNQNINQGLNQTINQNTNTNSSHVKPQTHLIHTQSPIPQPQTPPTASIDDTWKSQMENKINSFDCKLNDLVDVLRSNQRLLMNQQEQQSHTSRPEYNDRDSMGRTPLSRQLSEDSHTTKSLDEESVPKRRKLEEKLSDDFREDVLTLEDAKELFHFFDKNITPQLFGFEIAKFSVENIWNNSPILICAICTIASMHHPNSRLSQVHQQLLKHLHKLCGNLLFQGRPTTEVEGFNTILALIFCSFWLADSQMFTGLALQLAKEIGLDRPQQNTPGAQTSGLNPKDRLKLWYLLYVLDGQQSLTYNRQPLVNSSEYSLQHSRSLLMVHDKSITDAQDKEKQDEGKQNELIEKPLQSKTDLSGNSKETSPTFTDMRLVSQVEYNQALSEAFRGNAWDLLTPSSLGIPSKSNLELDKWMVSWTVLLSPMNNGAVWSSKSTLIYYNFAKMHINSHAVRHLKAQGSSGFPNLEQLTASPRPEPPKHSKPISEDWEDTSDEEEEEEFISNKDLVSTDESIVNANIALNAAQAVLNLVLNDADIKNNLKYVPVHVHIMLYYASLLSVEDSIDLNSTESVTAALNKSITSLRSVSSLRRIIMENFPVDKHFGDRLVTSLDELIDEKASKLKNTINEADITISERNTFLSQLSSLKSHEPDKFELFEEKENKRSSPGVYAWPGSDHGHPSQR